MSKLGYNLRSTLVGFLGVSISLWFIQRCYGYFVLSEDHPVNKVLQSVGGKPLLLSMVDISDASTFALIPIVISMITAFWIYIGLSASSALIAYSLIKAMGQRRPKALKAD